MEWTNSSPSISFAGTSKEGIGKDSQNGNASTNRHSQSNLLGSGHVLTVLQTNTREELVTESLAIVANYEIVAHVS